MSATKRRTKRITTARPRRHTLRARGVAKLVDEKPTPVTMSSSSSDWRTPAWIREFVRKHYGPIKLDPAATPATSLGRTHYNRHDGGLTKPWIGRVYCNPPHARALGENVDPWLRKAVEEIDAKRAHTVVMLVPSRTDTIVFHDVVIRRAHTVYLIRGRLRFESPGVKNGATFPSMLVIFNQVRRASAMPHFKVLERPDVVAPPPPRPRKKAAR
jgi:phage N-6-adenine-methyltransferase